MARAGLVYRLLVPASPIATSGMLSLAFKIAFSVFAAKGVNLKLPFPPSRNARAQTGIQLLAWLPAWAGLTDLRAGRAVELLRDWRIAETPIQAVRLARHQTPRRVRTLLAGLTEAASQ